MPLEREIDLDNALPIIAAERIMVRIDSYPLGASAQVMMRKVIALFDKCQSKENAKHVLRAP